jgi:hypothetical protein
MYTAGQASRADIAGDMMSRCRITLVVSFAIAVFGVGRARAQDPVALPQVTIKGEPGARFLTGFVKDTGGMPLSDATVSIGKLQKIVRTQADGSFRLDSLPKGKFEIRARKLGYAPKVVEVKVGDQGGRVDDFELVPAARALPAVVTAIARLGLWGVVADTAFAILPGALVTVLGADMSTTTDSLGAFYMPVKEGKYMVSVTKPEFRERVFSVSIPSDSGRRVSISMMPGGPAAKERSWNTADLAGRMAWTKPGEGALYTHEQIDKMEIQWAYDAIVGGLIRGGAHGERPDPSCYALIDGGPGTVKIGDLSTEELESIEVYPGAGRQTIGLGTAVRPTSNGQIQVGRRGVASAAIAPPRSDFLIMERLARLNFNKNCPLVYVWTR